MKGRKNVFKPDYGRISAHYDLFDKLNFANVSRRSRDYFLDSLPFVPQNPIIVGCGTGDFAVSYVRRFNPPKLTVNDISEAMLRRTVQKLAKTGWKGQLIQRHLDITKAEGRGEYDFVSLNYILNLFSPAARGEFLTHVSRILSLGGVIQVADFARPSNPWLLPIYHFNWFLANAFFLIFSFTRPNRLGDMVPQFNASGFRVEQRKEFLGGLYSAYLLRWK